MNIPSISSLPRVIRCRRLALGLSEHNLAAAINEPGQAIMIRMIEGGLAKVPLGWCRKLATALHMDSVELALLVLKDHAPEMEDVLRTALTRSAAQGA